MLRIEAALVCMWYPPPTSPFGIAKRAKGKAHDRVRGHLSYLRGQARLNLESIENLAYQHHLDKTTLWRLLDEPTTSWNQNLMLAGHQPAHNGPRSAHDVTHGFNRLGQQMHLTQESWTCLYQVRREFLFIHWEKKWAKAAFPWFKLCCWHLKIYNISWIQHELSLLTNSIQPWHPGGWWCFSSVFIPNCSSTVQEPTRRVQKALNITLVLMKAVMGLFIYIV